MSVRAAGVVERAAKWARRKPTLAAAYTLGLLAVLLGGLGGAAVWQWRAAATGARRRRRAARATARRRREGEAPRAAPRGREPSGSGRSSSGVEYGRTMQVAHQEWRENNVAATLALLDSTRPDLRGWEWRYVHRLCHSDLLTLKGHTGAVISASFSPDGSRIVTGSRRQDGEGLGRQDAAPRSSRSRGTPVASIRRRSAPTGRGSSPRVTTGRRRSGTRRSGAEVLTLKGHTGRVYSASFSPDGSRIVTGSWDKTAKVWDAQDAAPRSSPSRGTPAASCRRRSARTGRGSSPRVATGRRRSGTRGAAPRSSRSRGTPVVVMSASFSPDGSRIVTGE